MSHRKVLSQGKEQNPGVSKFSFRDFQALAVRSSPAPSSSIDVVVSSSTKIPPPPPCRSIRYSNAAKGTRGWEEDPFLVAYKECTKSGISKGGGVVAAAGVKKKSKLFGFSCKSIDSCEVRDRDTFFKLRSDGGIRVSSWK